MRVGRPDVHMYVHVSVVFTLPALLQTSVHKQVPGCTVACCYCYLLCLPAAANFHIVVSQDVVTVAVVLKMLAP